MKFSHHLESRQGGRSNNEDRLMFCQSEAALLLVAADGMGGYDAGEVAAELTVDLLKARFSESARPRLDDPFAFLDSGLRAAHTALHAHAKRKGMAKTPCTTCVAAVIQDNVAYWVHAGDSRLFHLREGRVLTQTRDHSYLRRLLDAGQITPSQALRHPERHLVTSCLGGPQPPEIDFSRQTPLETGDILLLATDGLWQVIGGEQLATLLQHPPHLQRLPALMAVAEKQAGPQGDNLSLVAVRWEDSYSAALAPQPTHDSNEIDKVLADIDAALQRYSAPR